MVKYMETIVKSLRFCAEPRRWLPIFIVDMVFFSLLLGMISSPNAATSFIQSMVTGTPAEMVAAFVLIVTGWFLSRLWVTGAVVWQSYKEKEFDKSWRVSCRRYPHLLGSMAVVIVITTALGLAPFMGWMFSVVVSLAFFFVLQPIVIKKQPMGKAIQDSYMIFIKSFKRLKYTDNFFMLWIIFVAAMGLISFYIVFFHTVASGFSMIGILGTLAAWITLILMAFLLLYSSVFRMWLIISIVSGIITLVSLLPAFLVGLSSITRELLVLGGGNIISAMVIFFLTNPGILLAVGFMFMVGSSIATAFTLKAQTEYYLQLKKKRFGFF